MTRLTTPETAELLHTALHATRDAIQTFHEDEQLTPENLFVVSDCLRVARLAARGGPHDEQVAAAWRALSLREIGSTETGVESVLARIHATGPCGLGGDRRLPPRIEAFANVESKIQGVVMKHQRPERFVFVPMLIISFPEHPRRATTAYGIYSVDAWAIREGKTCFVKQDFLVYQRRDDDVRYYGSGEGSEPIENFCERFNAPNYGCERRGDSWHCADHWYCDEADREKRLPGEADFRAAMATAIEQARRLAPTAAR